MPSRDLGVGVLLAEGLLLVCVPAPAAFAPEALLEEGHLGLILPQLPRRRSPELAEPADQPAQPQGIQEVEHFDDGPLLVQERGAYGLGRGNMAIIIFLV